MEVGNDEGVAVVVGVAVRTGLTLAGAEVVSVGDGVAEAIAVAVGVAGAAPYTIRTRSYAQSTM